MLNHYHLLNKPKLLEYRQRRMSFPVRIPVTMKLSVYIENNEGEKITGELHNLSYGGAGIIFFPDKTIMKTGRMHECAIELPNDGWIYCTIELRFSKTARSQKNAARRHAVCRFVRHAVTLDKPQYQRYLSEKQS